MIRTSSAEREKESEDIRTELPECPVCLQNYDESITVPRVLPCGHSACDRCLALLPSPPAHPGTVRCPACNQLMRLPPPLGPKSLPKNIDLLRFFPSSSSKPKPRFDPNPEPDDGDVVHFLPRLWTADALVQLWKPWLLPPDSVSLCPLQLDDKPKAYQTLVWGNRRPSSSHAIQQAVSLLPITTCSVESKCLRLSYMTKVMESVSQIEEEMRARLEFLLEACAMQRSGICRVLGLWMDPDEGSSLFLVCERFRQSLSCVVNDEGKQRLGLNTVGKFGIGVIGMELCEVVMNFHSKGVLFGCLDMDCFHFDMYGHCLLDMNYILAKSKCIREDIGGKNFDLDKTYEFLSPEVIVALREGSMSQCSGSDVWSLGYILAMIFTGDTEFSRFLFEKYYRPILEGNGNFADELLGKYLEWRQRVVSKLEAVLIGTKFDPLIEILSLCLHNLVEFRPQVRDIWCCIRSILFEFTDEDIIGFAESEEKASKENLVSCLFFWNVGCISKGRGSASLPQDNNGIVEDILENGMIGSNGSNMNGLKLEKDDGDLSKDIHNGEFKFDTLQGHQDCITGLAIGGGYLFSSSFDKTVNVWSLQDNSHVQSLRGHEHKVMAVVVVDDIQTLCVSGDSGSGIFIWKIGTPLEQELLHKWYEQNDWRYSGIHALATSGGYLYTGSGDQSIKAWSLQDYSLAYTMRGHNSTVSSLAVANGVLYSGSWDGCIRLWCLGDHSLLSVLGNDTPDASPPILSLSVHGHFLVSGHENGSIKIWENDIFVKSVQVQDGAISAVHLDTKWLFTGGWSKSINIQKLSENEFQRNVVPVASISCDSVITSLMYWHGKLFVGYPNKDITELLRTRWLERKNMSMTSRSTIMKPNDYNEMAAYAFIRPRTGTIKWRDEKKKLKNIGVNHTF